MATSLQAQTKMPTLNDIIVFKNDGTNSVGMIDIILWEGILVGVNVRPHFKLAVSLKIEFETGCDGARTNFVTQPIFRTKTSSQWATCLTMGSTKQNGRHLKGSAACMTQSLSFKVWMNLFP